MTQNQNRSFQSRHSQPGIASSQVEATYGDLKCVVLFILLRPLLAEACTLECCNLDRPFHLVDTSDTKRMQGKQVRVFCRRWFTEHSWLTYCVSRKKYSVSVVVPLSRNTCLLSAQRLIVHSFLLDLITGRRRRTGFVIVNKAILIWKRVKRMQHYNNHP